MRHKWHGFDPWVGKIHWRRAWQPIPVFLPGGLQSLASRRVGYGWVTEEAWIVLVGAISKILWEQTRKETQRSLELAQKHRAWKEGVEGPTINQLFPLSERLLFPIFGNSILKKHISLIFKVRFSDAKDSVAVQSGISHCWVKQSVCSVFNFLVPI